MSELNRDLLRWVLLVGAAPVWWPFLRTLWRDFNAALREEGGLFGRRPGARELERIQREKAAAPPTLTHEPWARPEERRRSPLARRGAPGGARAPAPSTGRSPPGPRSSGGPRFR